MSDMKSISFSEIPLSTLDLPSRWWGDIPLFNKKDAIKLLDYCEINGYGVLGIEGFNFSNKFRVPNMDAIVDFSGSIGTNFNEFKKKSIEISKNFLIHFVDNDTDIEFEFCLIE